MINYNFKKAIALFAMILLAAGFAAGILVFAYSVSDKSIVSSRPLTPTLHLRVIDNKVDTIYVYTQP